MPIIDYSLAGNGDLGVYTPNQLFSGEADIITGPDTILTGLVLDKWTVLAKNTAGKLVAMDPAQTDGRQLGIAITMAPINTTAATAASPLGVSVPPQVPGVAGDAVTEVYLGGVFNPDVLNWPSATNTLLLRKLAFARTNIVIQRPL